MLVDWEAHQLKNDRDKLLILMAGHTFGLLSAVDYKGIEALKSCFTEFRYIHQYDFLYKRSYFYEVAPFCVITFFIFISYFLCGIISFVISINCIFVTE